MAQFTYENIKAAQAVADEFGYKAARDFMDELGVMPSDIVLPQDFIAAVELAFKLYNPADKGRYGKNTEVMERAIGWLEGGRPWAKWGEFWARKTGKADIGDRCECKTGAGDWLRSFTAGTAEAIIAQYRHRQTDILWTTSEFRIRCTWEQLLEYLEQYNAKGLSTWFKKTPKSSPTTSEMVLELQTWSNSKPKVAYLKKCPYCE